MQYFGKEESICDALLKSKNLFWEGKSGPVKTSQMGPAVMILHIVQEHWDVQYMMISIYTYIHMTFCGAGIQDTSVNEDQDVTKYQGGEETFMELLATNTSTETDVKTTLDDELAQVRVIRHELCTMQVVQSYCPYSVSYIFSYAD